MGWRTPTLPGMVLVEGWGCLDCELSGGIRSGSVGHEDAAGDVIQEPVDARQQVLPGDSAAAPDAPVVATDRVQLQGLEGGKVWAPGTKGPAHPQPLPSPGPGKSKSPSKVCFGGSLPWPLVKIRVSQGTWALCHHHASTTPYNKIATRARDVVLWALQMSSLSIHPHGPVSPQGLCLPFH